jgi:hypothetical protein
MIPIASRRNDPAGLELIFQPDITPAWQWCNGVAGLRQK